MSRYKDLHLAYIGVKTANAQYWNELRQMIKSIGSEFSSYLDVGKDLIDVAGTKRPAVMIGAAGENSSFKTWSVDTLPKDGSAITFALCLSFPYAADAEPKPEFVYELSIWKDAKGYWVKRVDAPSESFFGPEFTQLFDKLISETAASISKARRL